MWLGVPLGESFEVDYRNHTEPFDTKEEALARAKKVSKSIEPVYPVTVRDDDGKDIATFQHGKRLS